MNEQNPKFSIIIPNWNGEQFIARCISSLDLSAKTTKKNYEIIVVDDASNDSSIEIIKQNFPHINLIENKTNIGFGASCNKGIFSAKGDLIILMNNDIAAKDGLVENLIKHFDKKENSDLFCVSCKTMDWNDDQPNHLNMSFEFSKGNVNLKYADSKTLSQTMFFQGGGCAFRKDIFFKLGGFCPIYHPGYWEDYDISYNALKNGYKILYEPEAVALHFGKSSFKKKYGEEAVEVLVERNKLIFTLINISDMDFIISFFIYLPIRISKQLLLNGNSKQLKAFIKTFPKIPAILKQRQSRLNNYKFPDKQIINKFR